MSLVHRHVPRPGDDRLLRVNWSLGAGLEGRGVLVTGAAGGIGLKVAEAFAAVGARVMAVDLEQDAANAAVARLGGSGHVAVAAQLTDLARHESLVEEARSRLGSLHVLANLAGVLRRRPELDAISEPDWDLQHDVNLKAAFFLCRAAGRAMIAQGSGGRIITFASQGWWTGGLGGSVVYATTKGGIVSMTRGLARTLGPSRITVNSIAPGFIRTSMLMTDLPASEYEGLVKQIPLGYVAEPEEVAGAVIFLASDHARYITGATINISGGYLMY
jgi:NAD(P)-dependent dehydrogenase (short-subunit alcohol dehydrogenase family)